MWVRGLKRDVKAASVYCAKVAPYVGAWIETNKDKEQEQEELVAPYVGAWIETDSISWFCKSRPVAPYVGAWIETSLNAEDIGALVEEKIRAI